MSVEHGCEILFRNIVYFPRLKNSEIVQFILATVCAAFMIKFRSYNDLHRGIAYILRLPGIGSVGLSLKNKILCFRVPPMEQGYYAQNYARLEVY